LAKKLKKLLFRELKLIRQQLWIANDFMHKNKHRFGRKINGQRNAKIEWSDKNIFIYENN